MVEKVKPSKSLNKRVDALEDQLKQTIELTNCCTEDIQELKTATRKLRQGLAELRSPKPKAAT